MIKLEHIVLPNFEQMEFVIEGMRNPKNSWEKSDSEFYGCNFDETSFGNWYKLGPNDHDLMQRLSNAGTEHRKYMRMMPVWVRITAPLYWWKEFDTYKVGTVANSCSTMHKIADKEFTLDDFSYDNLFPWSIDVLQDTIVEMNYYRNIYLNGGEIKWADTKVYKPKDKEIWWQMIQLLPSSYNQTRNVMLNYEVLANIYRQRRGHKLDEWRKVCMWIEELPYSELITGKEK